MVNDDQLRQLTREEHAAKDCYYAEHLSSDIYLHGERCLYAEAQRPLLLQQMIAGMREAVRLLDERLGASGANSDS